MNQPKKRFVSISLSVLMAFTTMLSSVGTVFAEETEIDTSAVTTTETTNNEANPYGLASKTKDGVYSSCVLLEFQHYQGEFERHCGGWLFNRSDFAD